MRLNCPRCGLTLNFRSASIAPHYCPRCLVRRREAVEFVPVAAEPAGGSRSAVLVLERKVLDEPGQLE